MEGETLKKAEKKRGRQKGNRKRAGTTGGWIGRVEKGGSLESSLAIGHPFRSTWNEESRSTEKFNKAHALD